MEVKYFGFSVSTETDNIPLDQFFRHLSSISGFSDDKGVNERIFYINDSSNDYYKGLIVTVKDQKAYCKYKTNSTSLIIEVEDIGPDNKMLDFNFFIVNKNNGLGIYQYYHQSCTVNGLGEYLKKYYREYRTNLIDSAIIAEGKANSVEVSQKRQAEIRLKFKDKLDFLMLKKKEDIDIIMAEYKAAKSFEYEYAYLTPEVIDATALSNYMIRKRERIYFKPMRDLSSLGSSLLSFIKSDLFKDGKITLEKDNGVQETLRVMDIPDCFHVEDYDQLTKKINGLDASKFYEHPFINEIVNICESEKYKHIFQADIKSK